MSQAGHCVVAAGTRMPNRNGLSARDLAELGASLRDVALQAPVDRLFSRGRVASDDLTPLLSVRQLRRLEACGLIDDFGDGLESPFCLHVIEGLLVLTDPDVPDEEQAATYLDPLWEGKTLARVLVRGRVGEALEVGVGSGVLSLVMSRYAERVTGVDLNPRALEVSRFNAALNGIDRLRLLEGDLFESVTGERFDRVVFNSPTDQEEGRYHGLLMAGETILRRFYSALPGHLTEQGFGQVNLAMNDYPGSPFTERLRGWLGAAADRLQFLLLVLETQSSPARVWRRGWLTCRPGTAGWLQIPRCRYNHLPGSLGADAVSDLIRWIMDEEGPRSAVEPVSGEPYMQT